jgi:predicted permease
VSVGNGWRRLFRIHRPERDVDDEIAFHLAMREEKLRALGVPEGDARHVAQTRFGDPDRVREECLTIDRGYQREVRLMEWMASVRSDFLLALRALRRTPGFTLVAAITLALGIGATSAMFSLVDGILLRPLPYPEPDRLVYVGQKYPEMGLNRWGLSQQNLAQYRDQVREFKYLAGVAGREQTLTTDGRPERLRVLAVTGDFFDVLGVHPAIGRGFGREEDTPRTNDVAVLSYAYWQSRFAGDRSIIGRVIDLDEQPVRVLGVMPQDFVFQRSDIQVYRPLGLDPNRGFGFFITGIGRLANGATIEQAQRSATGVMWEWARQRHFVKAGIDPSKTKMSAVVRPWQEQQTGNVKRLLTVLQAAVVLILLIAIANVATLLSGRAAARTREIAVRSALGATRTRVTRQLLTESVALASIGGVLGVMLAVFLVRVLTHSSVISLPRIAEVSVSWRVIAFTGAMSVSAGLLFGLAPIVTLGRGNVRDYLAGSDKSGAAPATRRMNAALVTLQLALSVVLLVSAGLVLKSFRNLTSVYLGFDARNVTVVSLPLPAKKYSDPNAVVAATTNILERVRAIPGVVSASISWTQPFGGNTNTDGYMVERRQPGTTSGAEAEQTVQHAVSPGYFATIKQPLKFGRDFTFADRDSGSLPVAIVDEAFASKYWTGAEALGKRVRTTGDTTWLTIVGVAGSVRDQDIAVEPMPHMYFPFARNPDSRPVLMMRSSTDPAGPIASMRRVMAELEPGVPLDNVRPLDSWVGRSLDTRRVTEVLLVGFALVALLLASVGIYGVMSLYVTNRYREFGIRLAVGAEPGALVRLVLREGLAIAVAGVVLGLGGALLATRWVRALLYDVSATDPGVYTVLSVVLLAVATLACFIPARRAARSDPLVALRSD